METNNPGQNEANSHLNKQPNKKGHVSDLEAKELASYEVLRLK